MVWNLEDNPLNDRELRIYKYVKKQSGNAGLARNISRFVDLREYLDTHPFKSADELRRDVLSNGAPLFSKPESAQLFKLLVKKGGGPEVLDNALRQWVDFLYEWQPAFLQDVEDTVSPYFFILKTIESDETFGPLLSIALDSVTAILPSVAKSIQEITPTLVGLTGLPEGGPIGSVIGWMIASIFVGLAMMIHLSRDHFGQAFTVSFLLIPFLSNSLNSAAMSGEKILTSVAEKRQKLIGTTRNLLGDEMADGVDALVPDLLATEEEQAAKPKVDIQAKGKELVSSLAIPSKLRSLADSIEGGKRLSRHRHVKSKWRTLRKSKL